MAKPNVYDALIGMRFGRLEVVGMGEIIKDRRHVLCDCECGIKSKPVQAKDLKMGKIESCGCSYIGRNTYEIKDNYVILTIMDTNMINHEVLISAEDVELVKQYHWNYRQDGYVTTGNFKSKNQYLHRIIMGATEKNDIVDHINRNPSDNRRFNLRRVNPTESMINKGVDSRNKTGITGVYQEQRKKKTRFFAYIQVDKKTVNLGRYEKIEDAIKARQDAELKYYGDFSPLNSQKVIQENIDKLALEKENQTKQEDLINTQPYNQNIISHLTK